MNIKNNDTRCTTGSRLWIGTLLCYFNKNIIQRFKNDTVKITLMDKFIQLFFQSKSSVSTSWSKQSLKTARAIMVDH